MRSRLSQGGTLNSTALVRVLGAGCLPPPSVCAHWKFEAAFEAYGAGKVPPHKLQPPQSRQSGLNADCLSLAPQAGAAMCLQGEPSQPVHAVGGHWSLHKLKCCYEEVAAAALCMQLVLVVCMRLTSAAYDSRRELLQSKAANLGGQS